MTSPTIEVQIGASGRLVIPAEFQHLMGLASGDRMVARIEDDCLIFEKTETIKPVSTMLCWERLDC